MYQIKGKLKACTVSIRKSTVIVKGPFLFIASISNWHASTIFYEYARLYQSSKHRVNPLHVHIEYIAWYIIMFEATHYKLLL